MSAAPLPLLPATGSAGGQQPRTVELDAPQQAALRWLRLATVLAALVPTVVFGIVAAWLHDEAVRSAGQRAERLSRIAQEHALKLLQSNDLLLDRVVELVGTEPAASVREREGALHASLTTLQRTLEQVQSIWVIGEDGRPIATSRVYPLPANLDFSDRASFAHHRAGGGPGFLTPPRAGVLTGDVFFDQSRRRPLADGSFGGMVLVGLHPRYFTEFYRELATAQQGQTLTLVRSDGQVLARWPAAAPGARLGPQSPLMGPMQRGTAAGQLRAVSTVDGVERLGAYRKVGPWPAYVFAGIEMRAVRAEWLRSLGLLAAFTFPIAAALVLVCGVALRRTRQQLAAVAQLRTEAEHRQRVEDALRQAQKLEAMGHLTGGVAHDFNNLLMVVEMNALLLRRRLGEGESTRQLDAIQRAVGTGTQLTRQLLAFSHRQPLVLRVVDLREILPGLLDLVRPALGSSIQLGGEVAPGTRPVRIDTAELELALINLAVNARDAMPGGGAVQVRISNAPSSSPQPMVRISFADTGNGIDPEVLPHVFEPFFTTKPVGKGTGLGLSQVYGLCTRMGGTAEIESTPGRGTTVHLLFPACTADAATGDATLPGIAAERLGLAVLLVEDNPDIAAATTALLQSMGCTVSARPQAAEALALLRERGRAFDVVLSDVVMPGAMDGIALAREVRAHWPQVGLVLMTGYAQKLREAEVEGLVILPKPFSPALLAQALQAARQPAPA